MAVSWSLLSYKRLPWCSKNTALESSAVFASLEQPAALQGRGLSGAWGASGLRGMGCVRGPSTGTAAGVEPRRNSRQLSCLQAPAAGAGHGPSAALQLRGLALPQPGPEPAVPS